MERFPIPIIKNLQTLPQARVKFIRQLALIPHADAILVHLRTHWHTVGVDASLLGNSLNRLSSHSLEPVTLESGQMLLRACRQARVLLCDSSYRQSLRDAVPDADAADLPPPIYRPHIGLGALISGALKFYGSHKAALLEKAGLPEDANPSDALLAAAEENKDAPQLVFLWVLRALEPLSRIAAGADSLAWSFDDPLILAAALRSLAFLGRCRSPLGDRLASMAIDMAAAGRFHIAAGADGSYPPEGIQSAIAAVHVVSAASMAELDRAADVRAALAPLFMKHMAVFDPPALRSLLLSYAKVPLDGSPSSRIFPLVAQATLDALPRFPLRLLADVVECTARSNRLTSGRQEMHAWWPTMISHLGLALPDADHATFSRVLLALEDGNCTGQSTVTDAISHHLQTAGHAIAHQLPSVASAYVYAVGCSSLRPNSTAECWVPLLDGLSRGSLLPPQQLLHAIRGLVSAKLFTVPLDKDARRRELTRAAGKFLIDSLLATPQNSHDVLLESGGEIAAGLRDLGINLTSQYCLPGISLIAEALSDEQAAVSQVVLLADCTKNDVLLDVARSLIGHHAESGTISADIDDAPGWSVPVNFQANESQQIVQVLQQLLQSYATVLSTLPADEDALVGLLQLHRQFSKVATDIFEDLKSTGPLAGLVKDTVIPSFLGYTKRVLPLVNTVPLLAVLVDSLPPSDELDSAVRRLEELAAAPRSKPVQKIVDGALKKLASRRKGATSE